MSTMLLRRLGKEIKDVQADEHSGISVVSSGGSKTGKDGALDDLTHFQGIFAGPPDTPYEGGSYHVDIHIPPRYPFEPPVMKFTTKIWHPNISSQTGVICLDTLGKAWSPILTLKTCLISVQSLLVSPEPNDPQDAEVASMLMHDPDQFRDVARQWAITYAGANPREKRHISTATSSDQVTEKTAQDIARKLQSKHRSSSESDELYGGYNRRMIDKFVNMGFSVSAVVDAFENFEIPDREGIYYELEEEYAGDVVAYLLSED